MNLLMYDDNSESEMENSESLGNNKEVNEMDVTGNFNENNSLKYVHDLYMCEETNTQIIECQNIDKKKTWSS